MDLFENSFYILHASPRDSRHKLISISDERSLITDPELCREARTKLSNPRKRLNEEISWLIGEDSQTIQRFIDTLETLNDHENTSRTITMLAMGDSLFSPLARINWWSTILKDITEPRNFLLIDYIIKFSKTVEEIDPEVVLAQINSDRKIAGFPIEENIELVADEIKEQKLFHNRRINSILEKLGIERYSEIITESIDKITNNGTDWGSEFIYDLVSSYEIYSKQNIDIKKQNISKILDEIRFLSQNEASNTQIRQKIKILERSIENLKEITKPLRLCYASKSLKYNEDENIAKLVRNLSVDIYNEFENLTITSALNAIIREHFAYIPEILNLVNKDSQSLSQIQEDKKRFEQRLYYEFDIGIIFKKKLRITPESVYWGNEAIAIKEISALRWGGVKTNTGVTYSVILLGAGKEITIDTRRQNVFFEVIQRMLLMVGVKLIKKMISNLKNGNPIKIGTTEISEQGVIVEKFKFFGPNIKHLIYWRNLEHWNSDGNLCIRDKFDHSFHQEFSYLGTDNAVLFDFLFKKINEERVDKASDINLP